MLLCELQEGGAGSDPSLRAPTRVTTKQNAEHRTGLRDHENGRHQCGDDRLQKHAACNTRDTAVALTVTGIPEGPYSTQQLWQMNNYDGRQE